MPECGWWVIGSIGATGFLFAAAALRFMRGGRWVREPVEPEKRQGN